MSKSPSSHRYWSNNNPEPEDNPSSREVLYNRRAGAASQREIVTVPYVVALPKHPKAGRILSNFNSPRTLTGGTMKGNMFDPRRLTREILRPSATANWERMIS